MRAIKVMTVVGTRPEIIRLSSVIRRLDNTTAVEHYLVHTGQNYDYELNDIFFDDLQLRKPTYYLDAATSSSLETIANIISKIGPVIDEVKPDAFLILGDTNSCLSAIVAKKKHIPIFHMEAGNRCFDQRVPEEINRKIVDHISDINMPYSSIAREYLIKEGIAADRIIKTGSPLYEVINDHMDKILESDVLIRYKLKPQEYFLLSSHREENIDSEVNFYKLVDILNMIADKYNLPLIVSTHPRTFNKIKKEKIQLSSKVKLLKPFSFTDYIKLQINAKAVLSDSGTISEEASILGLRALNLRQAHERPEAMEEAVVMMVGFNKDRVLEGLNILESQKPNTIEKVSDYSVSNVSEKVLRIILSYVDYINRLVWNKS
ncbi:MAG: UDP-N-acetylglucosamine 2-epimerase (non-hydrolyzing) [Bacillota bacterium]|jgi:UDP-N-acetylglucosamine 2-epimerase (non-hydrolysing)|nr:UDP-N-acetylglucosamine 2-epimerase (non-hydrolyzing) [Bacillota bacterium]